MNFIIEMYIIFMTPLLLTGCSKNNMEEGSDSTIEKSSKTYTDSSSALGTVNVMTYNILWDKITDGDYQWTYRRKGITNLIKRHHPDIIGLQESFINQVRDISSKLESYKYFGYGTDDGKGETENPGRYQSMNAIVYDSTRFRLIEKGVFWYSNEPDHPNLGYAVSHFRNCVWGKFREMYKGEKGRIVYVFNTHLSLEDNVRIKQANLLETKIESIVGQDSLTLVIGDFNSDPVKTKSYDALANFLTDTRSICSGEVIGPRFSGSGIDVGSRTTGLMADHIFVRNIQRCTTYKVITDYVGDKYPSDHFPALAVISY